MLGQVIRNSAIFLGVIVIAVILLRDNTTILAPPAENHPPARVVQTDLQSGDRSEPSEEELLRNGDRTTEREDSGPETNGQMVVKAGPGGHFFVDADIDGNEVGFLVDTGASMVALSITDAETLGYAVHQIEYTGRASTANGEARFAPVVLRQVSIGDIVMNDVQAVIMQEPMAKSLLGMTFLRRLAGFEVKGDQLIMRW